MKAAIFRKNSNNFFSFHVINFYFYLEIILKCARENLILIFKISSIKLAYKKSANLYKKLLNSFKIITN